MADVEANFRTFWAPIVCPNGVWDLEQVKKELSDFLVLMARAEKVYYAVTGGKISKSSTRSDAVIECAEEYFAKLHICPGPHSCPD